MCHGLPIIVSHHALEETEERLFPASRHRSERIRKKLIKRHGGEFKKKPTCYRAFNGLIMHPAIYAKLEQEIGARNERKTDVPPAGPISTGLPAGAANPLFSSFPLSVSRPGWMTAYIPVV